MERIDSHQHFWRYDAARHDWMGEGMDKLKADYLPADLLPHLTACGLTGCVAVQASQTEAENEFLLDLAKQHPFIQGVVGWVDLQAPDLAERLAYYQQFPVLKGFRHVLHDEPQRDYMLRPAFGRGIAQLRDYGYTYDLLVFADQLAYTTTFVGAFPDQPFVLDHIAKPPIRQQTLAEWRTELRRLAAHPNVSCKVSGLVTEADWQAWRPTDFTAYLDVVVEVFGPSRLLFGSDWPVCTLAASYEQVYELVHTYFAGFSAAEQQQFFGGNATRFYHL